MNIVEITHQNFDDVVANHELLLIDFSAQWCAPCKSFAKIIAEVAKKYPDVTFATVDIDEESELAEDFRIRSVPYVMILRNRVVVFAESGALSANSLMDLLEQAKALDAANLRDENSPRK